MGCGPHSKRYPKNRAPLHVLRMSVQTYVYWQMPQIYLQPIGFRTQNKNSAPTQIVPKTSRSDNYKLLTALFSEGSFGWCNETHRNTSIIQYIRSFNILVTLRTLFVKYEVHTKTIAYNFKKVNTKSFRSQFKWY